MLPQANVVVPKVYKKARDAAAAAGTGLILNLNFYLMIQDKTRSYTLVMLLKVSLSNSSLTSSTRRWTSRALSWELVLITSDYSFSLTHMSNRQTLLEARTVQ